VSSNLEAQLTAALNVGSSKAILEQKEDNPLSQLLKVLMNEVLSEIVAKGFQYDVQASTLLSEFKVQDAIIDGDSVTVELTLPPDKFYWQYIDQGVNGLEVQRGAPRWGKAPLGTKTFSQSVDDWMHHRGVRPDGRVNGAKTMEQLNYLIRRKIVNEGKEPRPFVSDVLNENIVSLFREPIERLLGRAIQINIVAPWQ
jgi:hypothetical protein